MRRIWSRALASNKRKIKITNRGGNTPLYIYTMFTILVVNNNRYLINTESKHADKTCEMILRDFPKDAEVYFDNLNNSDL